MGCRPGPPRSGRRAASLRTASLQAFELAAAHVFKIGAVGPGRRRLIEIDGNAEAPPDFEAGLAGQHDALLQLDAGDGHERDHVCRADAGMGSLLAGQVDQLNGLARAAHRGFHDGGRLTGQGDDRAVVVGIHRPVEQAHSVHAHRGHNGLDPPGIGALGEVGNALDNWLRSLTCSTSSSPLRQSPVPRLSAQTACYFQRCIPPGSGCLR